MGDGLVQGRNTLNAIPITDYDFKALVILTDGLENRAAWLADVGGSIDNRTFAIGLGNETQVNTYALKKMLVGATFRHEKPRRIYARSKAPLSSALPAVA